MELLNRILRFPPIAFIAEMVQMYFSKRVGRAAAELTYFVVLTFFPILICLSAFLSAMNLNTAALIEQASAFLPESVVILFREYLQYIGSHASSSMLIGGLFLTLLFASAAVRSLMNIMEEICGTVSFRGLWQIVASVVFSILLLAAVYLSLAVIITGNWFFKHLGSLLGLPDLPAQLADWQWIKYLLLLGLVFLVVLLLYRFTAPLKKPRPPVIPGAMVASAAMAIASMVFSFMVSTSTRYSLVYGSLASMIILLVWMYLCGNILILGTVFNYVLFRRREAKHA